MSTLLISDKSKGRAPRRHLVHVVPRLQHQPNEVMQLFATQQLCRQGGNELNNEGGICPSRASPAPLRRAQPGPLPCPDEGPQPGPQTEVVPPGQGRGKGEESQAPRTHGCLGQGLDGRLEGAELGEQLQLQHEELQATGVAGRQEGAMGGGLSGSTLRAAHTPPMPGSAPHLGTWMRSSAKTSASERRLWSPWKVCSFSTFPGEMATVKLTRWQKPLCPPPSEPPHHLLPVRKHPEELQQLLRPIRHSCAMVDVCHDVLNGPRVRGELPRGLSHPEAWGPPLPPPLPLTS